LHIFLSDPQRGTAFLLDWLQPYQAKLRNEGHTGHWFYLRYWHGGPHFRVRFAGLNADQQEQLLADARKAAVRWSSPAPPRRAVYYSDHRFDGQPQDTGTLPWWDEGSVVSMDYEREWVRYGGAKAMHANEALFELSSTLSLAIIKASADNFGNRIALALPMLSASLLAFDPTGARIAPFFTRYAAYWRGVAGETATGALRVITNGSHRAALDAQIERLRDFTGGSSAEAVWVRGLRQSIARFEELYRAGELQSPLHGGVVRTREDYEDAVLAMLGSQMHMMNNRLGFGPAHEYWFATTLTAAKSPQ